MQSFISTARWRGEGVGAPPCGTHLHQKVSALCPADVRDPVDHERQDEADGAAQAPPGHQHRPAGRRGRREQQPRTQGPAAANECHTHTSLKGREGGQGGQNELVAVGDPPSLIFRFPKRNPAVDLDCVRSLLPPLMPL